MVGGYVVPGTALLVSGVAALPVVPPGTCQPLCGPAIRCRLRGVRLALRGVRQAASCEWHCQFSLCWRACGAAP
eukprot:10055217-Alexandrium_andersonii.AAC.1